MILPIYLRPVYLCLWYRKKIVLPIYLSSSFSLLLTPTKITNLPLTLTIHITSDRPQFPQAQTDTDPVYEVRTYRTCSHLITEIPVEFATSMHQIPRKHNARVYHMTLHRKSNLPRQPSLCCRSKMEGRRDNEDSD